MGRPGGRAAERAAPVARAPVAPATSAAESSARAVGDAAAADRLVPRADIAIAPRATSTPSIGRPLDATTRAHFEPRLGADLGSVRVDPDGAAARRLGARAYTYGEYIGFAPGQYAPSTTAGRRLLGHELAHVLQARASTAPPAIQRDCDPTTQTCPEETACAAGPDEPAPPVEEYECPATIDLDVDVAGPPSFSATSTRTTERVHLANPVYSRRREDYYLVPEQYVFTTPEEAAAGTCRAPPGAGGTTTDADPFGPAPDGDGPTPDATGARSTPATPTFVAGQTVYTLDGPLEVTAAVQGYVVTRVYTKFAVGAGSMTLALTAGGYVLVDAGMHQVGGRINDVLADAAVQRLADALAGAPLAEIMITHIHADHTALLPRVYARWEIGTLRINALQALLPSSSGSGTQLDDLARAMIAARRDRIAGEVRTELTATFGPWDLFIDPAARETALGEAVAAETTRRMAAMRPTNVALALPSGGTVVSVNAPLGAVALPPGFAFDAAPITRAGGGAGLVTLLDPRASTVTAAAAAGTPPTGGMVDTQSSTYVIDLPSGAQLIVVSDQRVEDLLELQRGFQDQLARFGTPRTFRVWDMTHHLQVGFSSGTGIVRGQQLAALTQMLSDFIDQRNAGGSVIGDALIVSVHGPGSGSDSYIDPANVWLLRSLGIEVFPATGGGSVLTAAQDMSILEVELDASTRVSGIAGPSYPGLSSSDYLLRRAAAAIAQLDGDIQRLQSERVDAEPGELPTIDADIARITAQRDGIQTAVDAYATAFHAELTRSTRGPTNARPDVAPTAGGTEPALAQATALRGLLVGFSAPVVGVVPRFTPGAMVVMGLGGSLTLDPTTRALFDARARVIELSAGLRWSSPVERRTEVVNALDAYRTQLLAARSSFPGTSDVIDRELARIDADLQRLVGMTGAALREMRDAVALAERLERNRAQARVVASVHEMMENATALDIIANNGGFAMVGGTLYRLTQAGESITFATVPLLPASVPRTEPPPPSLPPAAPTAPLAPTSSGPLATTGGAALGRPAAPGPIFIPQPLPPELAAFPNIINMSGRTIVFEGGTTLSPTPSEPLASARPGELIVRGYSTAWVVCDPVTRLPVAGAAIGGETWRVESNGRLTLLIDAYGDVQAEGASQRITTRNLAETSYGGRVAVAEPPLAGGPSTGTRVVAGGMGILMLANEILGPIGNILNIQRGNIARRRAQAEFWAEFGANPVREMRTQNGDEIQPAGTTAETAALWGDPVYDAVSGIDVASLGSTLAGRIRDYREFLLWTDLAAMLGVLRMTPARDPSVPASERHTPRTYQAIIQGRPGTRRNAYVDITSALRPIEERTLTALDADMRRTVAGWSSEDRGQIYRLRGGADTRISRLHDSGWLHGDEPIRSGPVVFGPDPWVHVRERRGDRALVEAANADARRSALMSAYAVHRSIEDVLSEVTDGGREILSRSPADGRLESFVAGPSADGRLGETRYYRHPGADYQNIWTVAIGQLNWFWVEEDDLVSIETSVIDDYAAGH